MIAVPAVTPVTTPLDPMTEATVGVPLLHVPPLVLSVKALALPTHTPNVPWIEARAKTELAQKSKVRIQSIFFIQ